MLEILFGNQNTERILFYILKNENCYGRALSLKFNSALSAFQSTLKKLEKANILVSLMKGHTRFYQFNPQYPFLVELKFFLEKAYQFFPEEIKEKYEEPLARKRPRRAGKPL